ncbi:MAG: hypothetical protein ACE5G7_05960 [Candidatus Hydrothermarchaeaceae archaeon]
MPRRIFPIYLSDEEKAEIKKRAEKTGLSIAEYLRRSALGYDIPVVARRKPRSPVEKKLLFKAMAEELRGKVRFLDDDTIEVEPW